MDHRRSAAVWDCSRIVGRNQDVARTHHGGLALAGGELERPAKGKHICWCGASRQWNEERGDESWNSTVAASASRSGATMLPATCEALAGPVEELNGRSIGRPRACFCGLAAGSLGPQPPRHQLPVISRRGLEHCLNP